jgi:hypothetical protein
VLWPAVLRGSVGTCTLKTSLQPRAFVHTYTGSRELRVINRVPMGGAFDLEKPTRCARTHARRQTLSCTTHHANVNRLQPPPPHPCPTKTTPFCAPFAVPCAAHAPSVFSEFISPEPAEQSNYNDG